MKTSAPSSTYKFSQSKASTTSDEMGMREMQRRAYSKRGYQYLLIKSPPASGKSRALMFIALDKLHKQGLKKAVIVVPERSIGGSFSDTNLMEYGFWADFTVEPRWNLCNAPDDSTKVLFGKFLESDDQILICTHSTFRNAFAEYGAEVLDDCLLAIDEFHHVSMSDDNVLGQQLTALIDRDKAHVVAMTGSYFRGDAVPVLSPGDEEKFQTVVYTYYEQLNGYEHLKTLGLGYYFYSGSYLQKDDETGLTPIQAVLDPAEKTIIHIPNVNARESTKDKIEEANAIMSSLGEWQGKDKETGFHLIETPEGRILRVADLVEDEKDRDLVMSSLKDTRANGDRDWVDIIIALGMAKEGFDWIWCEHALTVGYRSSLTEIVQIIGRATRDAPGKARAKFTNLIAEPTADDGVVADAINDTLKAIAASLLMEQVLIPNFKFTPKKPPEQSKPQEGLDYGEGGYDPNKTNIGVSSEVREGDQAEFVIEVKGLKEPTTPEGRRVCEEGIKDLVADVYSDRVLREQALFNPEAIPQETTVMRTMNIVRKRHPELSEEDAEAARQRVVAAMNMIQVANKGNGIEPDDDEPKSNTQLLNGIRKFALEVRDLDVDLIDSINPFQQAYSILSVQMNESTLRQLQAVIVSKKIALGEEEARDLAIKARDFMKSHGRAPSLKAADPWERKMAEGVAALARHVAKRKANEA